jgi:hypothetical protein
MRPFTSLFVGKCRQFALAGSCLLVAPIIGCGGSSPVAEKQDATVSASAPQTAGVADNVQSPESVVSEFLDGVRRGGDAAGVARLMTSKSREEYAAAGLVMEPLGAPDAKFEVTRSVPYGNDAVLVNSLWTEKVSTGETVTYQVGWALKKEAEGWRVSGLILDEDPEPRVFNFESREDVLALKTMQDVESDFENAPAPQNPPQQTAEQTNFNMPEMR